MPAHPSYANTPAWQPARRARAQTAAAAVGLMLVALACQTPALAATPTGAYDAPTTSQPASTENSLTLAQLRQRAAALGITQVKEMKVKGSLVKIKGYDQQHRKVKVTLDGHTGDVLYRHARSHAYGSAASTPPAATNTLSLPQLEKRATAQGIQVKEMKVKGLLLDVEGYDKQHREVDMTLDRRTGQVLYRGFDD